MFLAQCELFQSRYFSYVFVGTVLLEHYGATWSVYHWDWTGHAFYGITDHVRLSLMGREYELHYGPRSPVVFKCLNVKGTDGMDIEPSRA